MNTSKKNRESENSVMTALAGLCEMENDRVAERAARAAREEAEREEARRREEEQRSLEQARIEAEARARVEAEHRRRDEEAHNRIANLRAELAAVQAAREANQVELLARQQVTPPRRSRSTIQIAALLAVAVAMVIGGAAFLRSGDGQAAEPEAAAPVVEVVEAEPEAVEPETEPETPEPVVAEAEPEVTKPVRKPGKPGKPGKNPKPPKPPVEDWTTNLTCDDPMGCGKGPGLNL